MELANPDLNNLAFRLKLCLPRSAMMYNIILLKLKLVKNNAIDQIEIRVFTAEDKEVCDWGCITFIRIMGLPQTITSIFTHYSQPSSVLLHTLTGFIDWSIPQQFEGAENPVSEHLKEIHRPSCFTVHGPIEIYHLPSHINKKEKNPSTSPYIPCTLDPNDALQVNKVWAAAGPGTLELLQTSISLGVGSAGVKFQDTLVSWALALPFGSIHALHTSSDHRGQGLASIVMWEVSQRIREDGRIPVVQIYKDNEPSRKLNTRLGYVYSHNVHLIFYNPPQQP